MIDIKQLKNALVEYVGKDTPQIKRFVGYIDGINRKDKNDKDLSFNMSVTDFVKVYIKYNNVGIVVDGVNAVLTGYNKVFVTWVGYKNKVLSVYPESMFDSQLVRDGDVFTPAKESGSVIYSHSIANPFDSNKGIIGAYCIIKNKRGEFLETLGIDDFQNMKASAMMVSTWNKWESEFWLKSVIKRACKRHFNDVVEELEKIDNEDYHLEDGYVKLTPTEKTMSRHEGWINKQFMDLDYTSDEAKKRFINNVLKKDTYDTPKEAEEVSEALRIEKVDEE